LASQPSRNSAELDWPISNKLMAANEIILGPTILVSDRKTVLEEDLLDQVEQCEEQSTPCDCSKTREAHRTNFFQTFLLLLWSMPLFAASLIHTLSLSLPIESPVCVSQQVCAGKCCVKSCNV
jgi:hypothetical protein